VTAWVVALLFGIALVVVGGIAFTILALIPCIGWIAAILLGAFLAVWPNIVIFHLFGQVGALATKTA
jgi:putative Mn2+ efflux pump MntP